MKSKKLNSFTLYWNSQPIVVNYKPLSGELSKIFYNLVPDIPEEATDPNNQILLGLVLSKYVDSTIEDPNTAVMQALQKAFVAGEITKAEISTLINKKTLSGTEAIKRYNIYLELFKSMIDIDNITNLKNKELVLSPIDSEFWDKQNFVEIRSEVDRFRQLIN